MHFRFNTIGIFGVFLSVLFLLVIISGIIGALIYNSIPLSLTKYGRDIKSKEEIIDTIETSLKEADDLVSNTSKELEEIYVKRIRPFIKSKRTKWEYLFMEERELLDKRRNMIERYKDSVPVQDTHDLNALSSILVEKEKRSFMWTKLKIIRAWLTLHMPLTLALLTATVIHIVSIIYF
jgi:hypothetical protein